ncbi:hypothetical protein IWW43_000405 [Coemansia sp. RSA 1935]|nr:hypothetical protein J3F82_000694 [Coemansia sp. RSA 637]KAJ2536979.1 hypothetical protein IWW43_000405 [Coemansia sp. RSA 1935]
MAAFTVELGSGRRVTVRPAPSDTLQSVVVTACKQLPNAKPAESYELVHKNSVLPLSTIVRLANLPQGATLELRLVSSATARAQASAVIKVALQIVGAGRIIDDFAPTATLWDVLVTAERRSSGTLNLTARFVAPEKTAAQSISRGMSGFLKDLYTSNVQSDSASNPAPSPAEHDVIYQQPVVVLLNKEYATNDVLQATTLRSLGFTGGSLMVRLSFRDTPANMDDMHRATSTATTPPKSPDSPATQPLSFGCHSKLPVNESDKDDRNQDTKPVHAAEPCDSDVAATQNDTSSEPKGLCSEPKGLCSEPNPAEDTQVIKPTETKTKPSDTHTIRVFDAPPANTSSLASRIELPESFYDIGNDDVKLLVSAQRARQTESERGFASRQAHEAAALQRRAAFIDRYPETAIRFRFPDQVQIQASFASSAPVSELYKFVSRALRDPHLLQTLFVQPPVQNLDPQSAESLLDAKLTPAAVVHVRLSKDAGLRPETLSLLHPATSALAEPLEIPVVAAAPSSIQSPIVQAPLVSSSSQSPSAHKQESKTESKTNEKQGAPKLPKWLLAGQRRS